MHKISNFYIEYIKINMNTNKDILYYDGIIDHTTNIFKIAKNRVEQIIDKVGNAFVLVNRGEDVYWKKIAVSFPFTFNDCATGKKLYIDSSNSSSVDAPCSSSSSSSSSSTTIPCSSSCNNADADLLFYVSGITGQRNHFEWTHSDEKGR